VAKHGSIEHFSNLPLTRLTLKLADKVSKAVYLEKCGTYYEV